MATATYELCVDWDVDGSFATAGDDISADWISASITRGFASPLARMATVGRADFLVQNYAGDYSPASNAAAMPRLPVRFRMTSSSTTTTLFRGFVESIVPESGTKRGRRAVLHCVDAVALLDHHRGETALLESVYANTVISTVVAAAYTPPATSYQPGLNLFPFVADRWTPTVTFASYTFTSGREEVQASQKIQDAAASDWGRFFINAAGAPCFYNRHKTALDTTTKLTLTNAMLDMAYQKAVGSVFNHVEVTCQPRALGQVAEVLGQISQTVAPKIEAGATVTFSLLFRDPANTSQRVGGRSMFSPDQSTDYLCTDDEAGEGADVSGDVSVSMTAFADRAEIELTNAGSGIAYVQRLQVRGYAVRSRGPVTLTAEDAASIAAYQRRDLPIAAPLMSSPAEAQRLADYLLDVHKEPADEVRGVEFVANKTTALLDAARTLELLDRVVLTEDQTGLSSYAGFIYQMRHQISSQFEHRVSLDIETAYNVGGTPFRLDNSAIDGTDILIY